LDRTKININISKTLYTNFNILLKKDE